MHNIKIKILASLLLGVLLYSCNNRQDKLEYYQLQLNHIHSVIEATKTSNNKILETFNKLYLRSPEAVIEFQQKSLFVDSMSKHLCSYIDSLKYKLNTSGSLIDCQKPFSKQASKIFLVKSGLGQTLAIYFQSFQSQSEEKIHDTREIYAEVILERVPFVQVDSIPKWLDHCFNRTTVESLLLLSKFQLDILLAHNIQMAAYLNSIGAYDLRFDAILPIVTYDYQTTLQHQNNKASIVLGTFDSRIYSELELKNGAKSNFEYGKHKVYLPAYKQGINVVKGDLYVYPRQGDTLSFPISIDYLVI